MTCSLQIYRAQIGTFQSWNFSNRKKKILFSSDNEVRVNTSQLVCIILTVLTMSVLLRYGIPCNIQKFSQPGQRVISDSTNNKEIFAFYVIKQLLCDLSLSQTNQLSANVCVWIKSSDRNKAAHIYNGNKKQDGGVTCLY